MEERRARARRLYMSGETQKEIANLVGVTENTVGNWVKRFGWEEERSQQANTTENLARTMMEAAKEVSQLIIDKIRDGGKDVDITAITKCADNLVKVMAAAERISKVITKDMIIDVLITLERWLVKRAETDPELTPENVALINKYHREYIQAVSAEEV